MGKKSKEAVKKRSKKRRQIKKQRHRSRSNKQCKLVPRFDGVESSDFNEQSESDIKQSPRNNSCHSSRINIAIKKDIYYSDDPLAIRFSKWRVMKKYLSVLENKPF